MENKSIEEAANNYPNVASLGNLLEELYELESVKLYLEKYTLECVALKASSHTYMVNSEHFVKHIMLHSKSLVDIRIGEIKQALGKADEAFGKILQQEED